LKVVGDCWKFWFEPKEVTYRLQNLSLIAARSEETLNIKVVGNSISFLERVETQNFDTGRRNHEVLKSIGFSRYDFELDLIFLSFFWIVSFHYMIDFQGSLLDAISMYDAMTTSGPIHPHQKKKLAKYRWCTCSLWQNHTHPRG
jgi:hypothetical protein